MVNKTQHLLTNYLISFLHFSPICLEIFREPLQLPCQHTFCKSCLERITDDRWGRCKSYLMMILTKLLIITILGPVCRGCYRVPFAGVGSFEVNRTIVNLLESLPHTESKPMLKAKCALCKLEDTITVFVDWIYVRIIVRI